MPDARSELARTVLGRNLKVRKGETVLIEAWPHALPYAQAFVRESRRLGAQPTVLYEDDTAWWDAVKGKQFAAFSKLSRAERSAVASSDVFIYFWGPEDRPKADGLPDSVQERMMGYNEEWYRTARKAGLRGCRMTVAQATDPVARNFGLNGPKWRSRLVRAGAVDASRLRAKGQRVVKALKAGHELRITHPNGTDLRLELNGLHSRVDTGLIDAEAMKRPYGMLANNPAGQVLVAIDDSRASGTLRSNRTIYIGERRFAGARWTFEDGRLVKRSLKLGNREFESAFRKAPKERDRLGLLSIGLNPQARDLPPCEDTEEGAALVGIGGNAFVGGQVRIPFLGYALLGGGTITIDGKTLARGGRVS